MIQMLLQRGQARCTGLLAHRKNHRFATCFRLKRSGGWPVGMKNFHLGTAASQTFSAYSEMKIF
jgi:hypothetical protein